MNQVTPLKLYFEKTIELETACVVKHKMYKKKLLISHSKDIKKNNKNLGSSRIKVSEP